MARAVEEWIGKTDDTPVPDRVRLRVFDKHNGRCYICTRKILAGEYWEADHIHALVNGGPNRESNLAPACCNCCRPKTATDVAEKSAVATKRKKHILPHESKGRLRSRNSFRSTPSNARDVNADLEEA